MKGILFTLVVFVMTTFAFCQAKSSGKTSSKHSKSFAVLELFTSEGCSSCPSADRLLPQLMNTDSNIIALSFHVDYWDNLGWKDAFSNSSFTERQRQYGDQFHLESIYTPQLVINGEYELVGSNRQKAESLIKKVEEDAPTSEIKITNVKQQGQHLEVSCIIDGNNSGNTLLAALVQKHAERKIGAGENRGATLTHTNVVRSFVENDAKPKMNFDLDLPTDLKDGEWQLILYLQRKSDLKITTATIYQ